jgi:hypothetical protein
MRRVIALLCLLFACCANADDAPRPAPQLTFATREQAQALLAARDDFVSHLSAFDRAARVNRRAPVSEEEYRTFVASQALAWTPAQRSLVEQAYARLTPALDAIGVPWPEYVRLVVTTGAEEGDAPYTRADAIVIPASMLSSARTLPRVLAHELFHLLTRTNPALRQRTYAAIGFRPCGDVALPPALHDLRITNPDAVRNDACIAVRVQGSRTWAVPVLYARAPYDAQAGQPFFAYLVAKLLLLDASGALPPSTPIYDAAHPRLVDFDAVEGFFEQVGRNTQYIIHPEEILADNFALLITGVTQPPSPDVLDRIKAALAPPAGAR